MFSLQPFSCAASTFRVQLKLTRLVRLLFSPVASEMMDVTYSGISQALERVLFEENQNTQIFIHMSECVWLGILI